MTERTRVTLAAGKLEARNKAKAARNRRLDHLSRVIDELERKSFHAARCGAPRQAADLWTQAEAMRAARERERVADDA